MAQQHINLGTPPGGQDGDANRTAWGKAEANFTELYGRGLPVGRNLLINASWQVNQLQFAGGALAAGVYGHDCWKAGAGGCTYSVNATTGMVTHTSGSLVQVIESPRIAGLIVSGSVEDPSGPVTFSVDGQSGVIAAGAGRRSVTITVPLASTGNVTVTISANGATYSKPQLEVGPVPTVFEYVPVSIAALQCKRYYHTSYSNIAPGSSSLLGACVAAATAGTQMMQGQQFPVPMRIAPAISLWSTAGTAGAVMPISGGSNIAGMVAEQIGVMGFMRIAATSGGLSSGELYRFHYAADARL